MARLNADMQSVISCLKDSINGSQAEWEECKLIANPYERVYATAPCVGTEPCRQPCSRAFFKLWEIMHTVRPVSLFLPTAPIRAAYLAEAPGGFVEAVVTMRRALCCDGGGGSAAQQGDQHHAISLANSGGSHNVPVWKLPASWRRDNNVQIAGGTGDMLDRRNVDALVRQAGGENRCDIVTADGGFDFSGDFNNQELNMLPMIRAETAAALRLVAPGGTAVIKIFDAYLPETRAALRLFRSCFVNSAILKPMTSRPANAERYLVASGLVAPSHVSSCIARLYGDRAEDRLETQGEALADDAFGTTLSNLRAGVQQMKSIMDTMALVKKREKHVAGERAAETTAAIERQHRCRDAWFESFPLSRRS